MEHRTFLKDLPYHCLSLQLLVRANTAGRRHGAFQDPADSLSNNGRSLATAVDSTDLLGRNVLVEMQRAASEGRIPLGKGKLLN